VVFDPGKWLYRTRSEGLMGYSYLSVLLPLRVRLGHLSWNNSGGSATHTGQSGAPPDAVRCRSLSFCGVADRWRLGAVGAPDTVWCTPDSLVPPPDRWLGHVSRADRAADRWPGRPLAHRTVRCTPDSPVNYSRTPLMKSREERVRTS
jgi:hypothetical protein